MSFSPSFKVEGSSVVRPPLHCNNANGCYSSDELQTTPPLSNNPLILSVFVMPTPENLSHCYRRRIYLLPSCCSITRTATSSPLSRASQRKRNPRSPSVASREAPLRVLAAA